MELPESARREVIAVCDKVERVVLIFIFLREELDLAFAVAIDAALEDLHDEWNGGVWVRVLRVLLNVKRDLEGKSGARE